MLLPHQVRHLLRFLFLLQFIVVFLSWLVSRLCYPYLLLQFHLFLLVLLLLYRVQSLNQSRYFSFLVSCQYFRHLLTLRPSYLFLSTLSYLFWCLERKLSLQFPRHHERIESFRSPINCLILWIWVLLNLNSLLYSQFILCLHDSLSKHKKLFTSRKSGSDCNIFQELSYTRPDKIRYQTLKSCPQK